MPLQRPNSKLRLLPLPEQSDGASLNELLAETVLRPGELLEPLGHLAPAGFAQAARHLGVPLVLAASSVIERSLAIELLVSADDVCALDERAVAATVEGRPSRDVADYIRALVDALQGQSASGCDEQALTIPIRVGDQMRARGILPKLDPEAIRPAVQWELAAVAAGQTVAEWALRETLRRYADAAASRHAVAAERTA